MKAAASQEGLCSKKLVNFSYTVTRTKRKNGTRIQTVIRQFLNEKIDFVTLGCYLFLLKIQYRHSHSNFRYLSKKGCHVELAVELRASYRRPISVPQSDMVSCQLVQTFFNTCLHTARPKGQFRGIPLPILRNSGIVS